MRQEFSESLATVLISACSNDSWKECLFSSHWPVYVVCHQADYREACSYPGVKLCMSWNGPFDWGSLANIAVKNVVEDWILFVHDDITIPDRDEIEKLLEVARESKCEIVVPSISGESRCKRQSLKLSGWSHLTEILTDACVLVKKSLYEEAGGFPPTIVGKSCELPWLQLWSHKKNKYAAVAHDVVVKHVGNNTYAGLVSIEERRVEIARSMQWCVKNLGFPSDYNQRLGIPRLVQKNQGVAIAERFPFYVKIGDVRFAIRGDETKQEIVDLLVNHSPNEGIEYEGKTYRRFARGDKFVALEKRSTFKIGAHNRLGFGDTFFMMKLFSCLKANYPDCEIEVHSDISNADLFERCSDVDRVVRASYDHLGKDGIDIHRFGAFGIENAPANLARNFGVEYKREPPHYKVRKEDLEKAKIVFDSNGRNYEKPLIAVQAHGGWKAKRWSHTVQFIRQANYRGWQVWLIGTENLPRFRVGDDVLRTGPLALPTVLACLQMSDILVGFDSGATHAAAAVGIPIVSLWGPHDPRYILLDSEVYNTFAIRKRNPWTDCGEKHCRNLHGGSQCPLKNGSPGAVCIDEVSTHEVWNLISEAIEGNQSSQ